MATRIKLLSDRLYAEVDEVYRLRGARVEARWFALLRLLHEQGPLSTTEIASRLGTTHPAVSQLAPKLQGRGLIVRRRDQSERHAVRACRCLHDLRPG